MIDFVKGDLLQTTAEWIAQGVAEGNQEGLGTGLVLKISKKWPKIQRAFKRYCRQGKFRGGSIWIHPGVDGSPGLVYMATQANMYCANMPYLRKSLRRLRMWADNNSVGSVALPKIGAGLGKLSWMEEVRPLLIEILSASDTRFIVYETFRREHER